MPKDTVTLVGADGFEFIIDYKAACLSNTIKNSVSSEGATRSMRIAKCTSCK